MTVLTRLGRDKSTLVKRRSSVFESTGTLTLANKTFGQTIASRAAAGSGARTMCASFAATTLIVTTSLAGCTSEKGAGMDCSTYNSEKTNPSQYMANSNAVSDLLTLHGINPGASHHYNAAAGDYIMNLTVADEEVSDYCAKNPKSTIDKGITWSKFKN